MDEVLDEKTWESWTGGGQDSYLSRSMCAAVHCAHCAFVCIVTIVHCVHCDYCVSSAPSSSVLLDSEVGYVQIIVKYPSMISHATTGHLKPLSTCH